MWDVNRDIAQLKILIPGAHIIYRTKPDQFPFEDNSLASFCLAKRSPDKFVNLVSESVLVMDLLKQEAVSYLIKYFCKIHGKGCQLYSHFADCLIRIKINVCCFWISTAKQEYCFNFTLDFLVIFLILCSSRL